MRVCSVLASGLRVDCSRNDGGHELGEHQTCDDIYGAFDGRKNDADDATEGEFFVSVCAVVVDFQWIL